MRTGWAAAAAVAPVASACAARAGGVGRLGPGEASAARPRTGGGAVALSLEPPGAP